MESDDSDDMFTHERRDHHRHRSELDVRIEDDDDDGVKQSERGVTKKQSRYPNFSIMASDSESDHNENDHDEELEPTKKSGHAHDKKRHNPLLRARELEARAKSRERESHSPTAPQTGAPTISPTARVPEGREEKGPEGQDSRKVRRELAKSMSSGSPTGADASEGESETKRKRGKLSTEVTPIGVARKKTYGEAIEKEKGKGKGKGGAKPKASP